MASPTKAPPKATSRWGFLSQAVASVESRLDNILAEDDDLPKRPVSRTTATPRENAASPRASSDLSRSSSTARTNDRLQARLAQAMAKKEGSRTASPAPAPHSPSTVNAGGQKSTTEAEVTEDASTELVAPDSEDLAKQEQKNPSMPTVEVTGPPDGASDREDSSHSTTTNKELRPSLDATSLRSSTDVQSDQDAVVLGMQIEHEDVVARMQEEMNVYLEKIDALQHNLNILSKESSREAHDVRNSPAATENDKKLAEKDEKIALLIEEGTKLNKSEMQLRNLIKKLRTQSATLTKDQDAARSRAEKAEKSLQQQEEKSQKAEAARKRADEQLSKLAKSSSDVQAITKERNALKTTLAEVRSQLAQAHKSSEDAENKAQSELLEIQQRRNAELRDSLNSAKTEHDLTEDKLRREIADLKQSIEREKEQTRLMETDMLAEQAALESKLEAFRVRAEEVTSGDQGDSQAKLLRQIETLQAQYSAASSNWQGIESTLLGRITALENERDETVSRENDLRRRLRESTSKAKTASKELEQLQQQLSTVQEKSADDRAEAQSLTRRNRQLEEDVQTLKTDLEDYKKKAERELTRRVEEERSRLATQLQSPRKPSTPIDNLINPLERPLSRRSSTQPPLAFDSAVQSHSHTPPRVMSIASNHRTNGTIIQSIPEMPSIILDHEGSDFFAVPPTPASATNAESGGPHNINDMISASTMGAGPSVQLVERLSANIRKLESEKSASKDELVRLSVQRDEARKEVVTLMRDLEAKDGFEKKVKGLEEELKILDGKYTATLELLGEKTEQVEELKMDLAEVKQMYRQLCDTMGKT